MSLEEDAAYAVAAWQRFDHAVTDELLGAVTGAFAMVAAADGDLAESELERFIELVHDHAELFPGLDLVRLERSFRDLGSAFFTDPAVGQELALKHVAAVRGDAAHCELVRAAAEIALAADGRSLGGEQAALRRIVDMLATNTSG